jgi:aromatic ring-opening dioxygenase catalytic subunit (LigB family)
MEATDHPAYAKLTEVGREITTKVKPTAVVVFSAHWQAGPTTLQINAVEQTDLIYDFYGFPPHYYEYEYPNRGSPKVAEKVVEKLAAAGVEVEKVERGLDHGVWAGFMVGRCYQARMTFGFVAVLIQYPGQRSIPRRTR